MIALDTNVLVRVVAADDREQRDRAIREIRSGRRFTISKTVLLETVWVLSFTYRLGRDELVTVLRRIAGFRRFEIEDRSAVLGAIRMFAEGMDFADALHLMSARHADSFLTFDRGLAKKRPSGRSLPTIRVL